MNFKILSALAEINDIKDFRLRDFMHQLGMDEKQPAIFYRGLIKEVREIEHLQQQVATLERAKSEMEAKLSSKEQQVKNLGAKISGLEDGTQRRLKDLQSENHQLKNIASQLQEDAMNYEGIKEFLKGEKDARAVGALARLVYEILNEMLEVELGLRPRPDLRRLAQIRPQLRDDLMEVLEIPRDTLERELREAEQLIEGLKQVVSILAGGRV